jgi:hypothetical protein
MPAENTFFPVSNSRNASVNAKIIINSPKEKKPTIVKSSKIPSKGVYIKNHNKTNESSIHIILPKPEIIVDSKANSFFKTSSRA